MAKIKTSIKKVPIVPPILSLAGRDSDDIVSQGLLAEYRFDELSGQILYDHSGNNNNGQLGSNAGTDSNDPTPRGNGFTFDGNDYISLPYLLNPANGITIGVVAKATLGSSSQQILISQKDGTYTGKSLIYINDQASDAIGFNNSGGSTPTTFFVSNNTVFHAALSIATSYQFLINGNIVKSGDAIMAAGDGTFLIGVAKTGTGSFFSGTMYYLYVYNRPISYSEYLINDCVIKNDLIRRGVPVW
jgi:hypothetical protein